MSTVSTRCSSCKQDAPVVMRGVRATCAACGAPRSLLSAAVPINVAGQPARVGGGVAFVLGWVVLFGGLTAALVLGLLFHWILPAGIAGLVVGLPVAFVTLVVAAALLLGGSRLRKSGTVAARDAYVGAIASLAGRHGGVVTAPEVARALRMTQRAADDLLTELAKDPDARVAVDVDDNGNVLYRFTDLQPVEPAAMRPGVRVPPFAALAPGGEDAGEVAEEETKHPERRVVR